MPASTRRVCLASLFALCMLSLGCGQDKINQENFAKIKEGMSLREVENILGGPGTEAGDGAGVATQFGVEVGGGAKQGPTREYTWVSGQKSITVGILRDAVVRPRKSGF